MSLTITDYENVRQKLERSLLPAEHRVDPENNIILLPANFHWDDDVDPENAFYGRFAPELFYELNQKQAPVQFIGADEYPTEIFHKSVVPDLFLPTLFFGFSLWSQNPHFINLSINILSAQVTSYLNSLKPENRPQEVSLDVIVEVTPERTTKKLSYKGTASGLVNAPETIKAFLGEQIPEK